MPLKTKMRPKLLKCPFYQVDGSRPSLPGKNRAQRWGHLSRVPRGTISLEKSDGQARPGACPAEGATKHRSNKVRPGHNIALIYYGQSTREGKSPYI